MFIYNIKLNGSKIFKYFLIVVISFIICISGFIVFKIFSGASNASKKDSSCIPYNQVSKISSSNYTNVLKAVHENIDDYVGKKINFIGYIYRTYDLNENQFILARDMIISSDFKSVIVGFLCECDNSSSFSDGTWVEITGEITKGNYHGDMPIVEITNINQTDKPNDEMVYPPDEDYIPTNGLI